MQECRHCDKKAAWTPTTLWRSEFLPFGFFFILIMYLVSDDINNNNNALGFLLPRANKIIMKA